MLNAQQLKEYRQIRWLSTRDVAAYCNVSQPLIVQIENGQKRLTKHAHDEIITGINSAFKSKKKKTFKKPKVIHGIPVTDEEAEQRRKETQKKKAERALIRASAPPVWKRKLLYSPNELEILRAEGKTPDPDIIKIMIEKGLLEKEI